MSFSLEIRHGDLALNGSQFATISGGDKLVQDLRCALLTRLGSYEGEPEFGSTVDDIIGELDWHHAASLLQSEVNRVCADYQKQQISRNEYDGLTYGRSTLLPEEILLKVADIKFTDARDALIAKVVLNTGTGEVQINLPFPK